MSNDTPPSPEKMAEAFLELWQRNSEALMKDPQTMKWGMSFLQPFFSLQSQDDARPSSPAAAPPDSGELLRELQERVDALERRLADLESKA